MRLLHCANTYIDRPHSPDDFGYLGASITSFEEIVKPSAEAILKSIKGLPIEIVIKPHGPEGLDGWKRFIEDTKPNNKVILDAKTPIFEHLRECDAMVLSYWSTTIIEACLFGIQIIYLDLKNINSKCVRDFSLKGFMRVVNNFDDLRFYMERLTPVLARDSILDAYEMEKNIGEFLDKKL